MADQKVLITLMARMRCSPSTSARCATIISLPRIDVADQQLKVYAFAKIRSILQAITLQYSTKKPL